MRVDNELRVNRKHLQQAVRCVNRVGGIGKQPAVLCYHEGRLKIELQGCAFFADAEGKWVGQVKVPVALIKGLSRFFRPGAQTLLIATDGVELRIEQFFISCQWDALVYPRIQMPLDARLRDYLALPLKHFEEEIYRSDLSGQLSAAEQKRDTLVERAATTLRPLGIVGSDLLALVDIVLLEQLRYESSEAATDSELIRAMHTRFQEALEYLREHRRFSPDQLPRSDSNVDTAAERRQFGSRPGVVTAPSRADAKEETAAVLQPASLVASQAVPMPVFGDDDLGTAALDIDPNKVDVFVELAKAAMDLGVVKFEQWVQLIADNFGRKATLAGSVYIEAGWEVITELDESAQPSTATVAEILGDEEENSPATRDGPLSGILDETQQQLEMPGGKRPTLAAGSTERPSIAKRSGPLREIPDEQSLIESLEKELQRNPPLLAHALNRWRVRTPEEERMNEPTFNDLAKLILPMSDRTQRISSQAEVVPPEQDMAKKYTQEADSDKLCEQQAVEASKQLKQVVASRMRDAWKDECGDEQGAPAGPAADPAEKPKAVKPNGLSAAELEVLKLAAKYLKLQIEAKAYRFADFIQRLAAEVEGGAQWVRDHAKLIVMDWNRTRDLQPNLGLDQSGDAGAIMDQLEAKAAPLVQDTAPDAEPPQAEPPKADKSKPEKPKHPEQLQQPKAEKKSNAPESASSFALKILSVPETIWKTLILPFKAARKVCGVDPPLKQMNTDVRRWRYGAEASNKGQELFLNDPEQALACFDTAIECGFDDNVIRTSRGSCLQRLGFDLDAIDDFDKAILADPDACHLYLMRSHSKRSTGDLQGALSDLKESHRVFAIDNAANRAMLAFAKQHPSQGVYSEYSLHLLVAGVEIGQEELTERYQQVMHPLKGDVVQRRRAESRRRDFPSACQYVNLSRYILREVVESGITELNDAIDAVYAKTRELIPNWTREMTQTAIGNAVQHEDPPRQQADPSTE